MRIRCRPTARRWRPVRLVPRPGPKPRRARPLRRHVPNRSRVPLRPRGPKLNPVQRFRRPGLKLSPVRLRPHGPNRSRVPQPLAPKRSRALLRHRDPSRKHGPQPHARNRSRVRLLLRGPNLIPRSTGKQPATPTPRKLAVTRGLFCAYSWLGRRPAISISRPPYSGWSFWRMRYATSTRLFWTSSRAMQRPAQSHPTHRMMPLCAPFPAGS